MITKIKKATKIALASGCNMIITRGEYYKTNKEII